MPSGLGQINAMDRDEFVRVVGPTFEHSPWVAEKAWENRPFGNVQHLLECLCRTVRDAGEGRQLALVRAHPDLVGQAVLTAESTHEQSAAGLMNLTPEEAALFQGYNQEYKERFGFPFVICARLNQKTAILESFPQRLKKDATTELNTALAEIEKIAQLRLHDLIS